MHEAAFHWVAQNAQKLGPFEKVIEIGSLDINGSVRPVFQGAEYIGLDPQEGPGVDWVGDALDYEPEKKVDCVVCCEVLEHSPKWEELVKKGMEWLDEDGVFLITAAGPGREPHSAVDGSHNVRDFEHYENVSPAALAKALMPEFVTEGTANVGVQVRTVGQDTQAVAVRHVV
jgi:hypothetical protein